MKKITGNAIFSYIIIAGFQILFYIFSHDKVVEWYTQNNVVNRRPDISWGMQLRYILYEFIIIVFIQNVLNILIDNKRIIISLSACLVFVLLTADFYKIYPLRTLNICICGFLCIFLSSILVFFRYGIFKYRLIKNEN